MIVLFVQEFRLLHYAGEVTYNCVGFLDKNNDLLFRDIKEVNSPIYSHCFRLKYILESHKW